MNILFLSLATVSEQSYNFNRKVVLANCMEQENTLSSGSNADQLRIS